MSVYGMGRHPAELPLICKLIRYGKGANPLHLENQAKGHGACGYGFNLLENV